ncbi:MAG: hypothetical protein IT301_06355 [Dehalococcoidia bacterium]|nr:hypothetical protein [Dehalococcoidia bacterium]
MPDPTYTYRGAWATATAYLANDLISSGGVAYVCTSGHTSDAANGPPDAGHWSLLITPSASTAYATVEEYRAAIGKDSLDDDVVVAEDLLAASRWWDEKLNRPFGFGLSAAPSARKFYVHRAPSGAGSKSLYVDDFASLTGLSVTIGGTVQDVTDYEAFPLNALSKPEQWPFDELRSLTAAGWPLGEEITVTARWGWPAVPMGLKKATIEWTAIWRGESPAATARVGELDQVQSFSPYHLSQLKRITSMYRRPRNPTSGNRP